MHEDDWWYTACVCNKAVSPDSKMLFCEKCNKHVTTVGARYRIKLCVVDATENAIFVIFDREGMSMFNKSCAVMFEAEDKASSNQLIPNDISNLSGQIDVVDWSCDSSYIGHGNGKEMTIGSSSNAVVQDMMPKFEIIVIENENQTDSKVNEQEACDLSKMTMELCPSMEAQRFTPLPTFSASQYPVDLSNDSEELTPLKRESPTELGNIDLHVPLMLLKKIKIEKE